MSRYIDADELIKSLEKQKKDTIFSEDIFSAVTIAAHMLVVGSIDCARTVDVEPVRHGHWINANYGRHYICSVCTRIYETYGFDYCPNCGAKMDGVTEAKKDEV